MLPGKVGDLLKRVRFNDFALLKFSRKAAAENQDVAQFVMFTALMDNKGLMGQSRTFKVAIRRSKKEINQTFSSYRTQRKFFNLPDACGIQHLQNKVDTFADQFAELSLFEKKQFDETAPPLKTGADYFGSYCKQKGERFPAYCTKRFRIHDVWENR